MSEQKAGPYRVTRIEGLATIAYEVVGPRLEYGPTGEDKAGRLAVLLNAAYAQGCADRTALVEAIDDLVTAARGMPVSHDNLCQATLDGAVATAAALLTRLGEANG